MIEQPVTKVALVFDDGFAKSCRAIAKLFERYRLRAVFAVLAESPSFLSSFGDWPLWNKFAQQGHIIHLHGFDHTSLPTIPFDEATKSLERCFDTFEKRLPGFQLSQALFHYPYNQDTPELNEWLLERVAGVRAGGSGFNTTEDIAKRVYHCTAHGPDFCDQHLIEQIDRCLIERPPLFIYNLHGIDGEGWGPIHLEALEQILLTIVRQPELCYWDFSAPLK